MKKSFVFITLIAIGLLGWAGQVYLLPPTLGVTKPVRGPAVEAVYATGSVEPTILVPIAARSTGRLVSLNVDEGQSVKKGDVLAQLDDADLQSSLSQLKAKADYAKTEFERKSGLLKQGLVSRQAFDQARTDLDAANAAVSTASAQAGYMQLIAPEDGLILRRDGEVGQMIAANQTVFSMSCCAPLRISTEVDEEDIVDVKAGQAVLIRADAFPGQVFHGHVKSITPKGDSVSRSYRVRIELDADTPLLIGMTTETNIILHESKDALLIPSTALRGTKVQTVQDGRVHEQDIKIGAKGDEQTEVLSGLQDSDVVIAAYDGTLQDGQKVRTSPVSGHGKKRHAAAR